ncbi:MAG: hypothetical protein ABIQ89_00045 [Candidatus Saccharimonadales bacterium]
MPEQIPLHLGRKLAAVAVGIGFVLAAEHGVADKLIEPLPQEYVDAVYNRTHDGSKLNLVHSEDSDEIKTQADKEYIEIAGTNDQNEQLGRIMLFGGLGLVGTGGTTIYLSYRNRRQQAAEPSTNKQAVAAAE